MSFLFKESTEEKCFQEHVRITQSLADLIAYDPHDLEETIVTLFYHLQETPNPNPVLEPLYALTTHLPHHCLP